MWENGREPRRPKRYARHQVGANVMRRVPTPTDSARDDGAKDKGKNPE